MPSTSDLKYHVMEVNFEAGDHAMPQNPADIALALRAGRTAWERYPYLERRFGERGMRFTNSDSCWLVTLSRNTVPSATKSLQWLRKVLSSRGIPTVILETHLVAIVEALAAEYPKLPQLRACFDRFLLDRDAERRALCDADGVAQLRDQYDRKLSACACLTVDSAADLIISAWFDEQSGIGGSLAAVRKWFVDAERFPKDWIAHVNKLVARLDQAAKRQR